MDKYTYSEVAVIINIVLLCHNSKGDSYVIHRMNVDNELISNILRFFYSFFYRQCGVGGVL